MVIQKTSVNRHILWIGAALVLSSWFGCSRSEAPPTAERNTPNATLYPFLQNRKWGYMFKNGKVVITPQYDNAEEFSEGLAAVSVNREWGYIDTQGKVVYPAKLVRASNFSEGLASVEVSGHNPNPGYVQNIGGAGVGYLTAIKDTLRYIDKNGQEAIHLPENTADPGDFGEGLAAIRIGNRWGYLNKKGELAISPQFGRAGRFSERLAPVKNTTNDLFGYCDAAGRMVIPYQYSAAQSFAEGLAAVQMKSTVPVEKDDAGATDPMVNLADDHWGYINKTGAQVIKPDYEQAGNFSEGLAPVKTGGLWGFIDKQGTMVIPARFGDGTKGFSHGLAWVRQGEQVAYITPTGDYAWSHIDISLPELHRRIPIPD